MGRSVTTPDATETAVEFIIDARPEHLRDHIALLTVEVDELKFANKMTSFLFHHGPAGSRQELAALVLTVEFRVEEQDGDIIVTDGAFTAVYFKPDKLDPQLKLKRRTQPCSRLYGIAGYQTNKHADD